MGEAKRRGTFEERKRQAIKRNKAALIASMGPSNTRDDEILRAGISPFLAQMTEAEWDERREKIFEALRSIDLGENLSEARPIRVQDDEIAWYLFLCQQALEDPLCMDVNQLARAAPFFAGLGERWPHAHRVTGIEGKVRDILWDYKKDPDGLIFELLVALSYAQLGWSVELLDVKPPEKSPDMRVYRDGVEFFVECKRLARRTEYAVRERDKYLRMWDTAKMVLAENAEWLWFRGVFHVDVEKLPDDFLKTIFERSLPLKLKDALIYDGPEATIHARHIDSHRVRSHFMSNKVKANSPMLQRLLGDDWAPLNSSVSVAHYARISEVVDCPAGVLGRYIEDISWACGFTREFDSPLSIEKKSKDLVKQISDAAKQLPKDAPSVIHVALETSEGPEVERARTAKLLEKIPAFKVEKPVMAIRVHRIQANACIDKLWEFDETVEKFQAGPAPDALLPTNVIVPDHADFKDGSHWELYGPRVD